MNGSGARLASGGTKSEQVLQALSLKTNFAWTLVGNVCFAACQWGTVVALTKLGSPATVGRFALGYAIATPVTTFARLQLRSLQVTDARNEFRFGDYLGLRWVTTVLGFAAICAVAFAAGYRLETAVVVILVAVAKSVESFSDVIYGLFQKHERLDRIAIAMILRGGGGLLGFVVILWYTASVAWATVAMGAWWVIVLLTYERSNGALLLRARAPASELYRACFHGATLKRLVWLALPLGLVMLLVTLNTNIPRYAIEHTLGEAGLGYFSAVGYLLLAENLLMDALGQAAVPRLAQSYQFDRAAFRRLLSRMLMIAVGLGLAGFAGAVFLGRPVLTLLYRPDYAAHVDVLILLMAAGAAANVMSVAGYALTSQRHFKVQLPWQALVAAASAVTAYLLVPRIGLAGAAWALILSYSVGILLAGGIELVIWRQERSGVA